MGIIRQQPGIVTLGQHRERRQRREVAVHGKHAVGCNQDARMLPAQLREQRLDMARIGVSERGHAGACQPGAGPQAGMGELVDQHQILRARERGDDAEIGEVAGTEHAGGLRSLAARQPPLELGEQRMVAGHQPGRTGANAVQAQRRDRRLLDLGMMGQVEVVVAAERDQPAAVAQGVDSGHTGGIGQRPAQTRALELGELGRRKPI